MKSVTDTLAQHLAGDTMTTARLWKLKRKATTEVVPQNVSLQGINVSDPSCNQVEVSAADVSAFGPAGTLGAEEIAGQSYAVADLADNNTSAASSWATTSSGDAVPADTSKVSIKAALYPGASTRVLAHMVAWFNGGTNGHIDVGYTDDLTQITKAIADMKSRGIDGVVLDWYGSGTPSDTVAGYLKSACEADGQMTFAICIDKGLSGGLTQSNFETAVAYVNSTYFGSSAYEKRNGRPLLLEFGCEQASIDWNAVKTYMGSHGNPYFLWQDLSAPTGATGISGGSQNAFDAPYTDGAFSWAGVSAVTGSDPESLNYLQNFYNSAKSHPTKIAMGSVRKGFNDALASWGSGRVMTQANGDTWADSFATLNANFSASSQLPYAQVVTWDDYEEGTEIETGIATNLAFGAVTASGNVILWSTTGTLKPFDHIGVYASSDGGVNYTFLGQAAKAATTIDLVSAFGLASGTYQVRLRAVGISSVQSVESADVTITVTNGGGTSIGSPTQVTGNDWEFVNGQWRTVDSIAPDSETNWIYAYGFNFNVPAGATILGIVVQANYYSQGSAAGLVEEVSLFNAGTPIGTEKTPNLAFTPSVQIMQLGSKTDLWGMGLTPALVNSLTFGFGIRCQVADLRLFLSGFGVTVYYGRPVTGSGSGGTSPLSIASTLAAHFNFTGNIEADATPDSRSGQAQIAVDSAKNLYVVSAYGDGFPLQGQVRYFDATTGELLGTLATIPAGSAVAKGSRPSGGGYIMETPSFGRWFLMSGGEVWGQQMIAVATPAAVGAAPGTLSNRLIPVFDGISAGANSGGMDVDDQGNIWIFTKDVVAGGSTYGGIPRLIKITMTSAGVLAQISTTDLSGAPWNFTTAYGVKFDPLSGNLILFGATAGGNVCYRVDQSTTAYTILATGPDMGSGVPINMGADGTFINGPSVTEYRASDFSVVKGPIDPLTQWGNTQAIDALWYDSANQLAYLYNHSFAAVQLVDLNSTAQAQLLDPAESGSEVSFGNQFLAPDASLYVTQFSGFIASAGAAGGFLDSWGEVLIAPSSQTVEATVTIGFTDHDIDILYDDGEGPVLYLARTGATWSAIDSKADMSPDNLEIDSFLESDLITEADLRGGLYDGSECTIYLVNWSDLTQKHLTLRYGVFGKVKIVNGLFTTEIRGLAYALGFTIGDYYGPLCRAELFSTPQNSPGRQWYCNLNAALFTQNGTVASSPDALHIVPSPGLIAKGGSGGGGAAPAGWFDFGLIVFTSGANQNLKYEIESWDGTTLTLEFPLANPVAAGDTFTIEPGCDKLLTTCINKYNNAVNHRGEAWIPGLDAVLDINPSQ